MAESNRKGSFWLFEAGQRSLDATWELYQNNTQYGWYAGGFTTAATSLVNRIDFASDTVNASPRSGLTTARWYMGAVGNANYGWFGGGIAGPAIPSTVSNVERIQYSNDSPSATSARGTFPAANSQMGAVSNPYYGWFGGGAGPTPIVLRIDFANDSPVSASIRGPLAVALVLVSGLGNPYYGWFGGGQIGPGVQFSYAQRIDYANDSPTAAIQRGSLSQARSGTAAVANLNYGWFGGGYVFPASYRSTIDRMDFANDSPTAAVPRGPLTAIKAGVGASGNQNYGWFTGGHLPAVVTNVDRIDYSNDTVSASVRGVLTTARGGHGATSGIAAYPQTPTSYNPSTGQAGIVGGGVGGFGWFGAGGALSSVDRIDFSNDSPATSSPRGPLSSAKQDLAGVGNANYGWVAGGQAAAVSIIDRIDYANDSPTAASRRGTLSGVRYKLAAAGNSNYGWWAGGGNGGGAVSIIDRVDYANDSPSATSPRGPLVAAKYSLAAAGNSNYGWFAGGGPVAVSTIDRVDYANDTVTTSRRGLMAGGRYGIAAAGNSNYGWFAGGAPAPFSTVERIDYSNDSPTAPSPRGPLSAARYYLAGASNSSYGWFGGGTFTVSTVDRINFSNDSPASASARGFLSVARTNLFATSNYVKGNSVNVTQYAYGSATVGTSGSQTYGWWGGGSTPTLISSVDRLDFANDSTTSSPRGTLSYTNAYLMAVGNQNFGWFAGAFPAISTVSRIDYANDTVVGTARGFVATARGQGGSASNSNYGWFGFGSAGTVVDRIDFSNDSPATGSLRGFGLVARNTGPGAVNNFNYGWFSGGIVSNTSVERINFANDSPTISSTRGFRNNSKGGISSSGNANYGWFANGFDITPGTTSFSNIERIDYSNDTITNSVRSNSAEARYWASGAGNANYGWHGGGLSINATTFTSRIDRIDYANDTNISGLTRGSLTTVKAGSAATSNYTK